LNVLIHALRLLTGISGDEGGFYQDPAKRATRPVSSRGEPGAD
jgi:hypothetical protein